ncbi:MAG: cation-translocating P-type ATPase [Candidatus Woesearchaeota archaeon]
MSRKKTDDDKLGETKSEHYWFIKTVDESVKLTESTLEGLTDEEASRRLKESGPNVIADDEGFKWWKSLLSNFNNLIIYVLIAAAIISLLFDHMLEFIVILVIIFITGFSGFFQEYSANKSIEALSRLTAKKVEVLRGGKAKEVFADHIVRGDIILLKRGMIVPADLRIIESKSITVDESILTGESVLKHKVTEQIEDQDVPLSERDNMAFSGTSVTGGSGKGLVVETGTNSEIGKISQALKDIGEKKSPIQQKVDIMSKNIAVIVIIASLLFFLLLLPQEMELFEKLLLTMAVLVGGIPESFPLVLTLSLSNGVRRMATKNAIVKDLSSVETLGTTTVICTDKTGTLTENKMSVQKIFFPDFAEMDVKGKGYEPESVFKIGKETKSKKDLQHHENFFKACVLCNDAELNMEDGEWNLKGEPTEGSLLTIAKSAGYDDVVLKEDNLRVAEIPFDPAQKFMISVNLKPGKKKATKNSEVAYLKGAVEKILDKSTHIRSRSGKIIKLTRSEKNKLMKQVEKYTSDALRVIAIATKEISVPVKLDRHGEIKKGDLHKVDKGYTLEGIVGIRDPIRDDVYDAVKECQKAGVQVKIVTGDHRTTAHAIGKELGMIKGPKDKIMLGSEIDNMDDDELDESISDVVIFARTTPEHKLRIVNSLQRCREIVAMTGDGVNDAPALKKADIGVSMGKGGTEVARESSNLVLADDNFATIVAAIREGRTIYSNIRRFIYYLLTITFTEMSLVIFTVLVGFVSPLSALMILFINIVTSIFPSMALSVEPTHMKVMEQKPRNTQEKLLSNYMLTKILIVMPVFFLGTFALFYWSLNRGDPVEKARTIAFTSIIMFEMFHVFNARSLHTTIFGKNFFKNKYVFMSISASLALLLFSVYVPLGQYVFETMPLSLVEWMIILGVSSLVIVVSELVKLMTKFEIDEQSTLQGVDLELK